MRSITLPGQKTLLFTLVLNLLFLAACTRPAAPASTAGNATEQTVTQPSAEPKKIAVPVKFLLVGDSMMEWGFGVCLEKALLEHDGVSVVREGVHSTGLNRIDYFDWYKKTDELIALHKPDILVVIFGANDGQGIIDDKGKISDIGSDSWARVYRERVNSYLARISPKVKKIYWMGHPIPGKKTFMRNFSVMNPIYQSETAKFPNAVYVNTWDRFAVNGKYSRALPDNNGRPQVARSGDGVHVTTFGGVIMAGEVMKEAMRDIDIK
jgi:hypothetical protein